MSVKGAIILKAKMPKAPSMGASALASGHKSTHAAVYHWNMHHGHNENVAAAKNGKFDADSKQHRTAAKQHLAAMHAAGPKHVADHLAKQKPSEHSLGLAAATAYRNHEGSFKEFNSKDNRHETLAKFRPAAAKPKKSMKKSYRGY